MTILSKRVAVMILSAGGGDDIIEVSGTGNVILIRAMDQMRLLLKPVHWVPSILQPKVRIIL